MLDESRLKVARLRRLANLDKGGVLGGLDGGAAVLDEEGELRRRRKTARESLGEGGGGASVPPDKNLEGSGG